MLRKLDLPQLRDELNEMVELVTGGELFENARFATTPPEYRRLNDIAMSGDGEPTTSPIFAEVVQLCADIRAAHGLEAVKLVLITNATMLQRPRVMEGLEIFDANNGEILGQAGCRHGGLLSADRSHGGQAGRGDGEPDRHRAEAANRDSVALHAAQR